MRGKSRPDVLMRLTLLQLTTTHFNAWMPSVARELSDYVGVHPGFHQEQLHVDEYAALRVVEAVQNLNMQLLVAKKPFRSGAQKDVEDSGDDADLEKDDGAWRKQEELFGGDGEDGALTEDEEFATTTTHACVAPLDLRELQRLLSQRA